MADTGRGERIAALFGAAVDRPAAERRAFVLAAAQAEEIRDEVLSLLDAMGRAEARPDRLDPQRAAALLGADEPVETLTGRRIGPYRILSVLGRGGMGVVCLAERADGAWQQQVALKLLPPALASGALAERFLLERRILARLEHPGIARLLDGGLTDDGDPYFVLEYVEGEPLTDGCDRRRLGLEERLRLFLRVCEAVQYAHGRLVVHRDLKPANILVTPAGEVKLLDFGISRLLDAGGVAEATVLTRHGLQPYTPGYAAPEQLRGEAVTVATDVYALGVVLHELLVGRRPRPAGTPPAPPTRPSTAVRRVAGASPEANDGFDPAAVAHARAASPERLARRLAGDLDTIVLQALREEPERRYESAQALADDVRRHLEGRPIAARRAGVVYVAGRFLRRHRLAAAAAALVAFAAAAGLVATTWQARLAARERDAARIEAAKLTAVQDYLVGLFRAADPGEARGEEITARQLVERGIERVGGELAGQPAVQIEMFKVLAEVAIELGTYERAAALLEEALGRVHELRGDDHVDTADLLALRGALRKYLGDPGAGEADLTRALATFRRLGATDRRLALYAENELGMVLRDQGRHEEAAGVMRSALANARRSQGERATDTAATLNNLGTVLRETGELAESETVLREALALHRELHGEEHPEVAVTLTSLGLTLAKRGELEAAERYFRDGVEMIGRTRGTDHPRYAIQLHNFARFLTDIGRRDESIDVAREALPILEVSFGDHHPRTGSLLDLLAGQLAAAERFDEATAVFERAERVLRETVGRQDPRYVVNRWRLAQALLRRGSPEAAMAPAAEAVAIAESLGSAGERQLANARYVRALVHLEREAPAAAAADLEQALAAYRVTYPEGHLSRSRSEVRLARAYRSLGRLEEAAPLARAAVTFFDGALPEGHPERVKAHETLAEIERHLVAAVRE